jgi:Na+-transporting NADH:ubiquinone oxidoreductase subunit F
MDHAIELLVDVKPGGDGSRYLESLKPGDEVEFTGPFGNFIVKDDEVGTRAEGQGMKENDEQRTGNRELLFVATGSGISAVRSMILDQLIAKRFTGKIRLWWGMRYAQDCFWIEDFDELEEENANFEWDLILSKAPDDWPLHAGHVTPHVLKYVRTQNSKLKIQNTMSFYLCGNRFMIEELSTELVKLGITAERIHSEKFF